ncbi:hypothetical protein [Actinoallomurus sp. CA-150999]|uniref:hypothetical protein n=1 Tax=Actinoallomurus sp. CA-150999 TaxID=3239887 RepID=UPI003D906A40
MSPFTPREAAHRMYQRAMGAPRRVFGRPLEEVTAERLDLLHQAEEHIAAALDGPPRRFVAEPNDETLTAYAAVVRAELDAATTTHT